MTTTIRDLMTRHVTTLAPEDDLMKANAIMQRGRIRHLPVVVGSKLVGLITHRDLLRAQIAALGMDTGDQLTTLAAVPASERMRTNVMTTSPNSDPAAVARIMLQHKVGCLPVVEGDELVGIVSESDFVKWALDLAGRAAA
jgi:CBS domain-containing membrane protein